MIGKVRRHISILNPKFLGIDRFKYTEVIHFLTFLEPSPDDSPKYQVQAHSAENTSQNEVRSCPADFLAMFKELLDGRSLYHPKLASGPCSVIFWNKRRRLLNHAVRTLKVSLE